MEKKKKVKIPFNKIDITTASDDDIIRSGIRHNTPQDMFCYFIMFLIFIFALVPVGLRIFMPREATTEEREVVYFNITCYKTTIRDNYELHTTLTSNYRDGKIGKMNMNFSYFKNSDDAEEGYVFAEIHEFEQLKLNGITSEIDIGKAVFNFDFEKHPELSQNETVKNYSRHSAVELNYLINDKGFSCSTNSETKMEVVDIETGKKIE